MSLFFLFFSFGWQREPRDLVLATLEAALNPQHPKQEGLSKTTNSGYQCFVGRSPDFDAAIVRSQNFQTTNWSRGGGGRATIFGVAFFLWYYYSLIIQLALVIM